MNPEIIPADDEPACYRDTYVSDLRFQVFHNYKGFRMILFHPVFSIETESAQHTYALLPWQLNRFVVRAQIQTCLWNPNYKISDNLCMHVRANFCSVLCEINFWTDRYSWWILNQHQLMMNLLAAETLFIWFFQVFVIQGFRMKNDSLPPKFKF